MGCNQRMLESDADQISGAVRAKAAGRVLIVGDGDITRDALERLLRTKGFHVVSAQVASPLVYELVAKSPEIDVIVVDVSHGSLEPCSVIERLKSMNRGVKVVLCTSPDSGDSAGKALCAGALAVIVRPFDPNQITGLLRMAMETCTGNDRVE